MPFIEAEIQDFIKGIESDVLPSAPEQLQQNIRIHLQNITSSKVRLVKYSLGKLIVELSRLGEKSPYSQQAIHFFDVYLEEPYLDLQSKAAEYFQNILSPKFESISFLIKKDGIQVGNIVNVTLNNGEVYKYFAKTHRGGLKFISRTDSSAGPLVVDPNELFIYKVLEGCGICPEVHFFYRDSKNFYIATKDVGDGFKIYENVKEQLSDLKSLYEALNELILICLGLPMSEIEKTKWNVIETLLSQYVGLTPWWNGLIKADLVSRLLWLGDVLDNSNNFGFTEDGSMFIIDFSVSRGYKDVKSNSATAVWEGFEIGSGHEWSREVLFKHLLFAREPSARKKQAAEVFRTQLAGLEEIIDQAAQEIHPLITELGLTLAETEAFNSFVALVRVNTALFRERFTHG